MSDTHTDDTNHLECRNRGCEREPVYHYKNPHSEANGAFCVIHLRNLRRDVSLDYWLENGFARPIDMDIQQSEADPR